MPRATVTAPSRLHFGLYAFGNSACAFGGVGVMVSEPRLVLSCEPAETLSIQGQLADRVRWFATHACESLAIGEPAFRLEVHSAPPEHAGLGLGTQLGLAVAAAIDTVVHGSTRPAVELARFVSRGKRSAVGAHGFDHGGWILDGGHGAPDQLGNLDARHAVPIDWRFVLINASTQDGLSGEQEKRAFARVPQIPAATTMKLRDLATEEMQPALAAQDFDRFANAVYDYGMAAGECFASVQGGPFASASIAELVAFLRSIGVHGCGQSSWGPTVFALAPSPAAADQIRDDVLACGGFSGASITITPAANQGAGITLS